MAQQLAYLNPAGNAIIKVRMTHGCLGPKLIQLLGG
jgi:hypothetical protein